ncbi:MAG: hypothetical protein O3A01_07135 [bacterium]|nr:hypothetical protein [bacterium]
MMWCILGVLVVGMGIPFMGMPQARPAGQPRCFPLKGVAFRCTLALARRSLVTLLIAVLLRAPYSLPHNQVGDGG